MIFANPGKVLPQTFATLVASVSIFCLGFDQGWSSTAVPSIRNDSNASFNSTEGDLKWITSLPPIGSLIGALCAAPLISFFGRRGTMGGIAPFYIGCYLLIGFASNVEMIIAGRFLAGVLCGVLSPAAQIYISEISSPRIRGALCSLTGVFLTVGILVAYGFGSFLNWSQLSFFAVTFPALLGLGSVVSPESPVWLLSKQKEEEARKSLQTLRGKATDIFEEFEVKRLDAVRSQSLQKVTFRSVTDPTFWKPLALSGMLMVFQQLSGNLAVVFNTATIFASTGSSFSSTVSSVIVGAVMVVTTIITMFLVDIAGRKMLMIISCAGMAVSQATLGGFFYIQAFESDEVVQSVAWLPLVSLIAFFIFFGVGMNGIPFIILGEIFPVQYRGICGSLSGATNRLFAFIIVRTFPELQLALGKYGCFWFYSAWCCIAVVCIMLLIPETKGKSLEEISRIFEGPSTISKDEENGRQNKGFSMDEISKSSR